MGGREDGYMPRLFAFEFNGAFTLICILHVYSVYILLNEYALALQVL